jgi:hypothetical protein
VGYFSEEPACRVGERGRVKKLKDMEELMGFRYKKSRTI